jgi:carboxylesterase
LAYADATTRIAALAEAEQRDAGIRPECRSQALLHDGPTAKAVLMLHGYHECTTQFSELAARFYQEGYDVYAPLAPRHGTVDPLAHTALRADELARYAGTSMDIVAALGQEAGVVGLSGGGVLATQLAITRPEQVRRLLVLSPFYRPASSQAPAVAVKPMVVLYGFRVLPDHITGSGFSFYALAQYLRITATLDTGAKLPSLRSVAVVTSPNDKNIDVATARRIPGDIADANGLTLGHYEIPADLGIGHDVVKPSELGAAKQDLYNRYFTLYEGSK